MVGLGITGMKRGGTVFCPQCGKTNRQGNNIKDSKGVTREKAALQLLTGGGDHEGSGEKGKNSTLVGNVHY